VRGTSPLTPGRFWLGADTRVWGRRWHHLYMKRIDDGRGAAWRRVATTEYRLGFCPPLEVVFAESDSASV